VPAGWSRWTRSPLCVLLHGCRQPPEDLASLAHLARWADGHGALVLLPRQAKDANDWRCWNWFEAGTAHGAGEAAIVAAQIVEVRRRYRARRERVWVAGMSAGGALAAILGLRHPRLVRGVLVHSGLACGAAATPASALRVMRDGPDADVVRVADEALVEQGRRMLDVVLVAVHGDRDDVVSLRNVDALVRQYLRFDGIARDPPPYAADRTLPPADATSHETTTALPFRIDEWRREQRTLVRRVVVEGLGHAWSGGDPAYPFADARGPDALELLARAMAGDARPPVDRGG
jgi:poly(3-hydroxybutyrate) depolymerase